MISMVFVFRIGGVFGMIAECYVNTIISKLYIALGHLIMSKKLPCLIVVVDHVKQVNIHS